MVSESDETESIRKKKEQWMKKKNESIQLKTTVRGIQLCLMYMQLT